MIRLLDAACENPLTADERDSARGKEGEISMHARCSSWLDPDSNYLEERSRCAIRDREVTGEVLGTPNAKMKEQLGKGGPKLFTPWIALQDLESAQED